MRLATMNLISVLQKVMSPVVKSYFAELVFDYRQEQIHETRSKLFRASQEIVSVSQAISEVGNHKHKHGHHSSSVSPSKAHMRKILASMVQKLDVDSLYSDKKDEEETHLQFEANETKIGHLKTPKLGGKMFQTQTDAVFPVVSRKKYSIHLDKDFGSNSSDEFNQNTIDKSNLIKKRIQDEGVEPSEPFTLKNLATIESKDQFSKVDRYFGGMDTSQLSCVSHLAELHNTLVKKGSADFKPTSNRKAKRGLINVFDAGFQEIKEAGFPIFSASDVNDIVIEDVKKPITKPFTNKSATKEKSKSKPARSKITTTFQNLKTMAKKENM